MPLILFIPICLLIGLMPFMAKGFLRSRYNGLIALGPFLLFILFVMHIPSVHTGQEIVEQYLWVPAFDVWLSFRLDGLSLLFSLLITGVGTLVFLYTSGYMAGGKGAARLYGWLGIFMMAMLGLVMSDNGISLFIFWELTSISSFFLIGFHQEDPAARKSALVALAVTGMGGMALLAGIIWLGQATGHHALSAMITGTEGSALEGPGRWIMGLLLLAAFTKSAQFPFHFWLPGAMKAPTPVSTYLHSATMVKAGIYLLLRFNPLWHDDPLWGQVLMTGGGLTMVYAAWQSLFRTDMKGVLAYTTVAALGMIVWLTGLGTQTALIAAVTFLLVHALYKAALFLVTGCVDHATGLRDISRLSGLRRWMMPVAIAAMIAALSNAGVPLLFGFISKDLVYEATLHTWQHQWWWLTLPFAVNVMLMWSGLQIGWRPFAGKNKRADELPLDFHAPGLLMWLPPVLLGIGSIMWGIMPGSIGDALLFPAAASAGAAVSGHALKLWHGVNTVFLTSMATLLAGAGLYIFLRPSHEREAWWARWTGFSPETMAVRVYGLLFTIAKKYTQWTQHGFLRNYILTILMVLFALLGFVLVTKFSFNLHIHRISPITVYEIIILVVMAISVIFSVLSPSRLSAVAALGGMGFALCVLFVFYSAPDLAMTQFTIDTLTVILFVLVLYRLPRYLDYSRASHRLRDAFIASLFGIIIFLTILEVLQEPMHNVVGKYYAENAYTAAKGKNIVNVIIVDFRGLDTLGEIAVLVIAAIGVLALLKLRLHESDNAGI